MRRLGFKLFVSLTAVCFQSLSVNSPASIGVDRYFIFSTAKAPIPSLKTLRFRISIV